MKKLIKFGPIGLVLVGAIAIASDVSAQLTVPPLSVTPDATGTYRVTIFGTPRTQVPVTLSGVGTSVTKSFRANGCGFVTIPNAANYANLAVNGTTIQTAYVLAKTAIAPPTCQGTESSILPPTHDYDEGNGFAFSQSWNIGGGSVLVKVPTLADAPNGRFVDATYSDNSAKSRFVSLNGCGLGTVSKVSGTAQISVNNGTAVQVDANPNTVGLRCSGDKVVAATTDFNFVDPLPAVFKDSQNSIYFTAAAGATVPVGLSAQASTKSVTSDRCGGLTIGSQLRPQTDAFTLGTTTIDPSTLLVGLKPNCKKQIDGSYAWDVTPTANIKTSAGQVFLKSTTEYPTGFGDRRILQIGLTGSATRNLKANSCGIASIKSTSTSPITGATTFTYSGTSYTVSDLPVNGASCINVGTSAAPDYKTFRAMN